MSNPATEYANSITKQRVASLCLALGWNSAHGSALEVLQDLMVRYIKLLGVNMKNLAELDNRTQPDLFDAFRTLFDMNISVEELSEYVEQFDSKALVTEAVPSFPQPSETRLNHLKPGSREVLHRPVHVHEHLPPMYPEMEVAEETRNTSLTEDQNSDIKKEAQNAQASDSSDHHPLREIASVMMTSAGFISPAREGRMAESRTPAVSRLVSQGSTFDESRPGSTEPQGPSKSKPSKPADETSDEGLIEDSEDEVTPAAKEPPKSKASTKSGGSNKLSVFQKQKPTPTNTGTPPKPSKPPKPPKAEKTPKTPNEKKQGPGRPRGRKKKVEINPTSKEFVPSSDDSSPERSRKQEKRGPEKSKLEKSLTSEPPAKKPRPAPAPEPPVKIEVDMISAPPDPNILPNNPLIPKFFGFDNMNQFPSEKREKSPEPAPKPTPSSSIETSKKDETNVVIKHSEEVVVPTSHKESKEERKEKKLKDKALKKAKKEKKEKHRDKDKDKHKDKSEKKDKEKKKKKEKRDLPEQPTLFAGTDQTTTTSGPKTSGPKIKIKEVKPEETKSPKIVIKNIGESSKNKPVLKQPELFADPTHIDRPKSSASGETNVTETKIKIKKDKKKDSDHERKRTSSGGKRHVEKRGSAIAAEAAIQSQPQEVATESPNTSFGEGSVTVSETVGYYVDADGNQIWICPACNQKDDGSPMIGCDECDDWYHWLCVGIQQEPADNQDWFCPRCVAKKSSMYLERKPSGKRGRPPKMR